MSESRISAPRLLAGLQAGTLAGLVLLGWFVLLSYYYFREPWALMNVLAASLRNNATWGHSFSSVTSTGIAAHLTACSILGILLGWVLPRPGPRAHISITGLMFGVILSLLVYQFFWLRYAPLLGEYIAPLAMWISHLLFGMSMAQFPRFYLQLEEPDPSLPPPIELPPAQNAMPLLEPTSAVWELPVEEPAPSEPPPQHGSDTTHPSPEPAGDEPTHPTPPTELPPAPHKPPEPTQ